VHLHGEAGEVDLVANEGSMKKFRDRIAKLVDKYEIQPGQIFNADQTGLFYSKLPNHSYAKREHKGTMRGEKLMKAKERVTIMVCVGSDGTKIPLTMVGKAVRP